jgi:hypothetical protein
LKPLKEGSLSKRAIARQLKISRLTLDRIENRLLFPGEIPPPQTKIVHFHEGDDKVPDEFKPTYHRCKGCGGMQQDNVPCLVCYHRKKQMKEYDCYMEELLTPLTPSPLSAVHSAVNKASNHRKGNSNEKSQGRKQRKRR